MMTVIYNTAWPNLAPVAINWLPVSGRKSSSIAASYHDSADWGQTRAMPPLVDIRYPLDPVALAHKGPLPDAIPSVLASRPPQAAESRSPHWRKLLKRPYGTAKITFKRSKSTLQRDGGRAPIRKNSAFAHIQHPKSDIPASAAEP